MSIKNRITEDLILISDLRKPTKVNTTVESLSNISLPDEDYADDSILIEPP